MIQTAVIQIDSTDYRFPQVTDKHFGMDKAGCILVYFYARFQQRRIMRFCQRVGNCLVGNSRQYQRDIDTPLRRKLQRCLQLPVQNQIWRHNMYIGQGPIENIHINPLPQLVIIKRTVPIRNHITLCSLHRLRRIRKKLRRPKLLLINPPHLQEHQSKAFDCLSLQHNGSILPMPEP